MDKRSKTGVLLLVVGMSLLVLSFPRDKTLNWPVSTVVTDKNGTALCGTLSPSGEWSLPVAFGEMGAWMPKVVVALEDQRFYTHSGVDILALLRAASQNMRAGKTVSGASTITSQVIRLSIGRERDLRGKAAEFWQATQLEHFLTKDGILELYLNRAPFGGNIRGVEAAARAWFNKPAKELSLGEAALLAGLLRGPAVYRPDRYPARARELRDRLIDTLAERGTATREEAERAKLEPLPAARHPIPARFRQASNQVIEHAGASAERDRFGRIRSTIDMDAQNMLQAELESSLASLPAGVTAAAVLVENKNGAVRGYIGNAKEGTASPASWVDCADSPRSPGSALKPFIYALAFESGRLTPATMLADAPLSAQGSSPRNYDRLFRGPVSTRTALADSLNVPAVRVFRAEGGRRVLDFYRRLGFTRITKDADWYGESLALGGCEVTPLELAAAYRTLAADGTSAPLLWTENGESAEGEKAVSAGAAALVLDILKDTRRLMPLYREIFGEDGTAIAFKTGTSYGLRDAWTAAVTKKYTLVVWFGDPTGKPHKALVGLQTAAPAAVRSMRKLSPVGTKWFDLPNEVKKWEVCALSGALRSQYCPQGIEDLYIEGISASEPCRMHVAQDGRFAIRWPEELAGFFNDGKQSEEPQNLIITSPRDKTVYIPFSAEDKLKLEAKGGRRPLYWFVDGELLGSTEKDEALFWRMSKGKHKISVADEEGGGAEADITVNGKGEENGEKNLPLLEEM